MLQKPLSSPFSRADELIKFCGLRYVGHEMLLAPLLFQVSQGNDIFVNQGCCSLRFYCVLCVDTQVEDKLVLCICDAEQLSLVGFGGLIGKVL